MGDSSGQADIQSDQPPVEASSGDEQDYIRLTWHFTEYNWEGSLQSDVSPGRGIWWPRWTWHFTECNWEGSLQSDVPSVEASGGQEQY